MSLKLGRVILAAVDNDGNGDESWQGSVEIQTTVPVYRSFAPGGIARLYRRRWQARLYNGRVSFDDVLATTQDPGELQPSVFQLVARFDLRNRPMAPVTFDLAEGETINLVDLVSIAAAPSVVEVVTDADRRAAEAAAARAAEIVANFDPGAEVGDLPDLSIYFENGMA